MVTKTCPNEACRAENKAEALYCVRCGTPLAVAAGPVAGRRLDKEGRARRIDQLLSALFLLMFLLVVGLVAVLSRTC